MKRSNQPPRRPTGIRHPLAKQNLIIERFDEARKRGLSPAQAIKGLGASRASVYRWKLARDPTRGLPAPMPTQAISIDAAIARLADTSNDDRLSFLEALFKFIAWLRWPTSPSNHPAAITVCVVAYLVQRHGAITVDQLDAADRDLLLRHLRLDIIAKLFSDYLFAMPSFEIWNIDNQKYTELDVLGHLAWFIVAYQPRTNDRRDAVSLNKAHYAFENDIFGRRWKVAHRTFRSFWLARGASAPFHYVERFHPTLEFSLNPASNDFSLSVDEVIHRRDDFILYLSRCRGVVETMCRKLDRRAVEAVSFPHFPDDLAPTFIEPPPLPILTTKAIQEFGRRDKR